MTALHLQLLLQLLVATAAAITITGTLMVASFICRFYRPCMMVLY